MKKSSLYRQLTWVFMPLVGLTLLVAVVFLPAEGGVDRNHMTESEKLQQLPAPLRAQSRLLIGGDIFLGRNVERRSLSSELEYEYPFSSIDTLGLNAYHSAIANLECPVTDTEVSFAEQSTVLKFNCRPEFLPYLAKYFDVLSLANNHTDNVDGERGLAETRENLDKNGLQYFGHYDNASKDDLCETITIKADLLFDDGSIEKTSLPIVMCGYHGVFKIPLDDELAMITHYSRYLPTIVMPHMGAEYQSFADSIRQRVYRQMIDNGADLVAGGHPHWVQNTEVYDGKLIVYSMGNLIFDQQFSSEVQRSLMIDLLLTVEFNENTKAWIAMAENCRTYKDNCIAEAQELGLKKLEGRFGYQLVATQLEDMVVKKAGQTVYDSVYKRANWAEVSALLNKNGE